MKLIAFPQVTAEQFTDRESLKAAKKFAQELAKRKGFKKIGR